MSTGFLLTIAVIALTLMSAFVGIIFPIDFFFYMFAGWLFHLKRVSDEVAWNPSSLAFGVVCLAIFTLGLHALLGWLVRALRQRNTANASEAELLPTTLLKWRWRSTVSIAALVIMLFVAGVCLTGIAHQIVWLQRSGSVLNRSGSRLHAQRHESSNNLKRISNATIAYAPQHMKSLPVAIGSPEGELLHGWMASLLPYLEKKELFEKIVLDSSWKSPENVPVYKTEVAIYQNPHLWSFADANDYPPAHYSANVRVIGGTKPRKLDDVSDGAAQTVFAGEIATELKPWGYPANWRDPALGINVGGGFGARWEKKGVNFNFVDGSVRFISEKINSSVLRALATPDGGELLRYETLPSTFDP